MRRAPLLAGLLLAATALPGAARAQDRGFTGTVGTSWVNISLTMPDCLQTASRALTGAGFTVGPLRPTDQTVFAGREGDVVMVRCIPARQIAVIATHSVRGQDMQGPAQAVGAALTGGAVPAPAAPVAPATPATPPATPATPPAGGGGSKF